MRPQGFSGGCWIWRFAVSRCGSSPSAPLSLARWLSFSACHWRLGSGPTSSKLAAVRLRCRDRQRPGGFRVEEVTRSGNDQTAIALAEPAGAACLGGRWDRAQGGRYRALKTCRRAENFCADRVDRRRNSSADQSYRSGPSNAIHWRGEYEKFKLVSHPHPPHLWHPDCFPAPKRRGSPPQNSRSRYPKWPQRLGARKKPPQPLQHRVSSDISLSRLGRTWLAWLVRGSFWSRKRCAIVILTRKLLGAPPWSRNRPKPPSQPQSTSLFRTAAIPKMVRKDATEMAPPKNQVAGRSCWKH